MSSINPNFFDLDAPATESSVPIKVEETLLDLNFGGADQAAAPVNPLDITDAQAAEAAEQVRNPGTAQIGRIANGLSNAVQVGRDNGTVPTRRWPWQR